MTTGSYQQFCPVAMAAEILCTRWTIILLREMFAGSTRFNDIRRGIPRISRTMLSERLQALRASVGRMTFDITKVTDELVDAEVEVAVPPSAGTTKRRV